jgi:DNA (cytosine-5)-methyltransferase 1
MTELTLGSLFDGSGGFPLGGILSGIKPLWASEIEPFPIRVTTKRLPFMKHYGDISKLSGADLASVDIITFGSPCQDMSVAGKRNGLDGARSSLFYEAIRVVKEMREKTDGKYPRYIVWENVPGAFSSNKGEDFKAVLESVCSIKTADFTVPGPPGGKWNNAGQIMAEGFSVAWRVLDAQFWGVPQRRRRIYLVADFAAGSAGKILFESESLSGHSEKSISKGKAAAGDAETCPGKTGTLCLNDQGGERMDVTEDKTATLRATANHPPLVFENHAQDSRFVGPLKKAQTVLATFGTGGNNQPFVVETPKTLKIRSGCEGGGKGVLIQENKSATLSCSNDQTVFVPRVYGICSKDSNSMKSSNPDSGIYKAETSRTLDANGGNPTCNQGGMAIVEGTKNPVAYGIDRAAYNQGRNAKFGFAIETELEPTMVAKGPGAVAEPTYSSSKASFFTLAEKEKANTLVATDYKDPPIVNDKEELTYIVRRLTPTECARLQGFPDGWCSELGTEEPSEEDIQMWAGIFEEHRKIMGTSTKPKSRNQIIKWLKNPHSDSAEYKMWGNGVALPCVVFVLSGIAWADAGCEVY